MNDNRDNENLNRTGRVIRNTGSHYIVAMDDNGELLTCKVKGNFRLKGIRTTNPVAVGDRVTVMDTGAGDTWFITAISPRANYIIRRASNLSKESHIIAANIDLAALVVSLVNPETSTTFIDRFLATAEAYNVPAALVINKTDLLGDEDRELLDAVEYLYSSIGYEVFTLSAKTGEGLDALRIRLKGITTLLSGNSGVGKSTLLNDLVPGAEARTASVSDAHHTGMHTTTFSEMYRFDVDGVASYLIDTPGIRGFGTLDFDRYHVAHYFPDIFAVSQDCRFDNCTHTHEPGCAVLAAVDNAEIAASRYASYLSILEDTDTRAGSTPSNKYRKPQ